MLNSCAIICYLYNQICASAGFLVWEEMWKWIDAIWMKQFSGFLFELHFEMFQLGNSTSMLFLGYRSIDILQLIMMHLVRNEVFLWQKRHKYVNLSISAITPSTYPIISYFQLMKSIYDDISRRVNLWLFLGERLPTTWKSNLPFFFPSKAKQVLNF